MSHYFIEDNSLTPDEKTFSLMIGGKEFIFTSDSGMFSNGEADPNSLLLIKSLMSLGLAENAKMLDLGCGWGLIGTTLAGLYGCDVTFSDINGNALLAAEENARKNGVSGTFIKSDGFADVVGNFDLITLNPPIHAGKETVLRLFSESADHLTKNGRFIIVINEKHGAKTYEKRLRENYKKVTSEKYKQTYIITSEL